MKQFIDIESRVGSTGLTFYNNFERTVATLINGYIQCENVKYIIHTVKVVHDQCANESCSQTKRYHHRWYFVLLTFNHINFYQTVVI